MIIVCKTNRKCDLSQKTLSNLSCSRDVYRELKIGEKYTVYAISIYKNVVRYFITDIPTWYPADLFDASDRLLYNEWYFEFYGNDVDGLNALWGYKELLDPVHYQNLLERESEDIAIFAKRKQEIDDYEALSSYIPKKSTSDAPMTKSRVYTDEPVDQRICPENLVQFLEKYLHGRIPSQKFAQQFDAFYRQRINFDNLDNAQTLAIKRLITVADDYAPDLIKPVRKYSSEKELKDAAQKALDCVKTSEYLSSIESKY